MNTDPSIVVGLLSQIIFWTALFISLAMFKRILGFGISVAFAEILRITDVTNQRKMARWFANGDEILKILTEIKEEQPKKNAD